MKTELQRSRIDTLLPCLALAFASFTSAASPVLAQRLLGTENGEWRYLGGDAGHTRSSPPDQINASNFANLEQAWLWRGVATPRRQVVAIDPATGETMASWAPASADPELGLVYLVTNASTIQSYTGHRPGHFPGSLVAFRLP